MTKRILVHVSGDVGRLLQIWTPPTASQESVTSSTMVLIFSAAQTTEFTQLKAAAERLGPAIISVIPFFQALEFTSDDLDASRMLQMRVATDPTIQAMSDPPIDFQRCESCLLPRSSRTQVNEVVITTNSRPSGLLLGYDVMILAHRRLLKRLQEAGYTNGLAVTPCRILFGPSSNSDYAWIRGTHDLGSPVGRVEYDVPCTGCGRSSIKTNENFLLTFADNSRDDADFATSSFFDPGFVAVSQRVYRFLRDQPDLPRNTIFEPIDFR